MSVQGITFNGLSLQDDTIKSSVIDHEGVSVLHNKVVIPHRDGEKLVSHNYGPKPIVIQGHITSTTQSGLDGKVDELKRYVVGAMNVDLDIDYRGETRRFKVNVKAVRLPRDYYHVTGVPFEIECEAINPPFGQDITSVSGYANASVSGTFSITTSGLASTDSLTISGTARPMPVIEFIVNVAGSMRSLQFTNTTTNTSILVTPTSITNGDRIKIDTENYVVTKNGVVITTYSGIFPTFNVGNNEFTVSVIGSSPNYNFGVSVIYKKWWL